MKKPKRAMTELVTKMAEQSSCSKNNRHAIKRQIMHPDIDNTDLDKARGLIFGLAIGDALGYPTEFMTLAQIKAEFGHDGIQDFPKNPALFTDDTQMSIAIAEALIKTGEQDLEFRDESFGTLVAKGRIEGRATVIM